MYYCPAEEKKPSGVGASDVKFSSDCLIGRAEESNVLDKFIFLSMTEDEATRIAKHDSLIKELGISWFHRTSSMDPSKQKLYISQKMREVGRLLQVLRSTEAGHILSVEEMLTPEKFDKVEKGRHQLHTLNQMHKEMQCSQSSHTIQIDLSIMIT
ncbi:hypothetical protein KUTeg_009468 [Tegillarca granosa]|uniref:Uncharacterized protein n=1 Tax=Tegillarca granosa TaxID=220873 RepID=A0ABQ9F3X9_TEGGR|nr:hypothetical protein KUTeg_009468 [Tegillarca granosa]